jgi:hypothetical protein
MAASTEASGRFTVFILLLTLFFITISDLLILDGLPRFSQKGQLSSGFCIGSVDHSSLLATELWVHRFGYDAPGAFLFPKTLAKKKNEQTRHREPFEIPAF